MKYIHEGKEYPVYITKKRIKRSHYRFRDGAFYVSIPYFFVNKTNIKNNLDKFAPALIKSSSKMNPIGEDYYYILGKKVNIAKCGTIAFTSGYSLKYKDKNDLEKKLKKWFLDLLISRQRYYENIMDIKPYKVIVRKMSTRYGTNSLKTRRIAYAYLLIHYPLDVIDSVIVHELSHDKIRNHGKKFYDFVYKWYPNYDKCHTRLRKGIFYDQIHQE